MTFDEFLNSNDAVVGSGAVFGLNMDGSVDMTDVGRMSQFDAHHGAYQGVDLRDPNLHGVAIGEDQAKQLGYGSRDEALGKVVKVTNYRTGDVSIAQIVDKAPRSQAHVEMTPAAHTAVGSKGDDPLAISELKGMDDFLGIKPESKPKTIGIDDFLGGKPKEPVKGVTPPEITNLPPEEKTLQAVLQKNLKAGAEADVYPKAQPVTPAEEKPDTPQEEPHTVLAKAANSINEAFSGARFATPAEFISNVQKLPIPEVAAIQNNPQLQNAFDGALNVVQGLVPMKIDQFLSLATPVTEAVKEVWQTGGAIKDWIGGASLEESNRKHFPEAFQFADAEKTPPGSVERWTAGLGTIANLLMAKGLTTAVSPTVKPASETAIPEPVRPASASESVAPAPPPAVAPEAFTSPVTQRFVPPTPLEVDLVNLRKTAEELQKSGVGISDAMADRIFQAEDAVARQPAPVTVPSGITGQVAESPVSTTPGDIAVGQQPIGEERPVSVGARPGIVPSGVKGGDALGVTGVSRAARSQAGEVDVIPAEVMSPEDHIANGRRLEANGANPETVVGAAVSRGSFDRNAVDLAVTRDAKLTEDARRAQQKSDAAPNNPALRQAATEAVRAQQQWEDFAIRPIRGQFADTGRSLQTAIDLDTGASIDYLKAFRKAQGRPPTPIESVALDRVSATVRKANNSGRSLAAHWEKELERTVKPRKTLRNMTELRESLDKLKADLLNPCKI